MTGESDHKDPDDIKLSRGESRRFFLTGAATSDGDFVFSELTASIFDLLLAVHWHRMIGIGSASGAGADGRTDCRTDGSVRGTSEFDKFGSLEQIGALQCAAC